MQLRRRRRAKVCNTQAAVAFLLFRVLEDGTRFRII